MTPVQRVVAPSEETRINQGAPNRNFGPGVPDFTSELFSRGSPGLVSYLQFRVVEDAPAGKTLTQARPQDPHHDPADRGIEPPPRGPSRPGRFVEANGGDLDQPAPSPADQVGGHQCAGKGRPLCDLP